jgi:hypothetical protein
MQLNDASPFNIKKKKKEKKPFILDGWKYCNEVGRELFIELQFIDIQFKIDDKLGKGDGNLNFQRQGTTIPNARNSP